MKKLYRPVGIKELALILETGATRYPPRLPFQPIFYPVLNEQYAIQIAEKWNTKDSNSGYCGYVTEFKISKEYISKFETHIVGSSIHEELWIPAETLEEFNTNINGPIKISHAYYGEKYSDNPNNNYIEQIKQLLNTLTTDPEKFTQEVQSNWIPLTYNYIAWMKADLSKEMSDTSKQNLLTQIKEILTQSQKWYFTI